MQKIRYALSFTVPERKLRVGLSQVALLPKLLDHIFSSVNLETFCPEGNERTLYCEEKLHVTGNWQSIEIVELLTVYKRP